MMMVSAVPLNPFLMMLAIGLGIGLTAAVAECVGWLWLAEPRSE